jgi:aldehyde:ferredoxin oxidoreductase
MITMQKKVLNQHGVGRAQAEGVRRAPLQIPGSEGFAMQDKGLELGGYECRGWGQALQYAIDNRGKLRYLYA